MEGKFLGGKIPASEFQKLARLVEEEGAVFQLHVLDLLRDVLADGALHQRTMDTLRQQLPERDIAEFLKSLPPADGYAAKAASVQEILKLVEGLDGTHVSPPDAAQLIASELIHRKRWEKVIDENPGTLEALKDRIG